MDRILLTLPCKNRAKAAFSLIEILIVVTIIALLATISIGSANSINSLRMKQAISTTTGTIARARQIAMSTNKEIYVRIYKMADERGVVGWRAMEYGIAQVITDPADPRYVDPSTPGFHTIFARVAPMERLPQGFIFHPSTIYSSILDSTNTALVSGTENAPEGGTRDYVSFLCLPEGRCTLPVANNWTLTVVNEQDALRTTKGLPANFTTLQLEPRTSRLWSYRP